MSRIEATKVGPQVESVRGSIREGDGVNLAAKADEKGVAPKDRLMEGEAIRSESVNLDSENGLACV